MGVNIRKLAVSILTEAEAADKYINLALSTHSVDRLEPNERASLFALVYTVTERKITYDYIISALAKRESTRIDPYTMMLLRIGVCQIVSMRSIPDFAAVNETVRLARNPGEASFVNAVLRATVRCKDSLPIPPKEKNYRRYLSVKYSFPLATVKHFDSLYGTEATEMILEFYNEEKYTDLTVNTTKISTDNFIALLRENGYDPIENCDTGISIRLKGSYNPELLPGFHEGYFFVQDRSSLLSAMALGVSPSDTVVDVASAPGGKSFAAAILSDGKAKIHSFDLHASKLSLITDGARRLGLGSISVAERDATTPDSTLIGKATKVICDVPCSGLGVLGKKPDLRYKDISDLSELCSLQYSILEASSRYLSDGGELVYSTCTLNPRENEDNVKRFLENHKEFKLTPLNVPGISSEDGTYTVLPHIYHSDGFFIAKMRLVK